MQGYSIYIKSKEKELKNLIQKLNAKNSNNTMKDETIYKLNQKLESLNRERLQSDDQRQDLNEQIRHWTSRSEALEQERNFLQTQIIEHKRQNKLLKLAISDIYSELAERDKTIEHLVRQTTVPATMQSIDY